MATLFSKAIQLLSGATDLKPQKSRPLRELTERDLIQLESQIGATLFGPVPKGHRREFFNDDQNHWIWHEEWVDAYGKTQSMTTRYEIQPRGILKVRLGEPYAYIEGEELRNLNMAAQLYYEEVARKIYKREPKKLG